MIRNPSKDNVIGILMIKKVDFEPEPESKGLKITLRLPKQNIKISNTHVRQKFFRKMGKVKAKKKFIGSSARSNPTNLTLATEEEFENSSEDLWQRISSQLQSGKF